MFVLEPLDNLAIESGAFLGGSMFRVFSVFLQRSLTEFVKFPSCKQIPLECAVGTLKFSGRSPSISWSHGHITYIEVCLGETNPQALSGWQIETVKCGACSINKVDLVYFVTLTPENFAFWGPCIVWGWLNWQGGSNYLQAQWIWRTDYLHIWIRTCQPIFPLSESSLNLQAGSHYQDFFYLHW